MISLPLVYTILALIAYTTSFWYLFIRLMSKREPNPWLFAVVAILALLLHGTVLCHAMLTPAGINYDVFNLVSFTSWLMLLLSLIFSILFSFFFILFFYEKMYTNIPIGRDGIVHTQVNVPSVGPFQFLVFLPNDIVRE